jgi:hypothetical protein
MRKRVSHLGLVALGATIALPMAVLASSHREAPAIGGLPRVDATDFYMFSSYEAGRTGFVTLIANYVPLQDPEGGPNFFPLDSSALYEIHVDNNGDANPDVTFQFRFTNRYKNLALPTGAAANVAIPLINAGAVDTTGANLNVAQTYSLTIVRGNRRTGTSAVVTQAADGSATFGKPADNIGNKSIPNYAAYAASYINGINIPGCTTAGRVFVGQRKEGFVADLGEIFDLVNTNPAGPRNAEGNTLSRKNVTSLALEVPTSCLTAGSDPVIGAWTTASLRQARILNPKPTNPNTASVQGGPWAQVSRLGMPLVNEVIIGLPDKDRFNASEPSGDAQFLTYVTHPTLPVLLNVLYGNAAKVPTTPRSDLVATFLTGITGINKPATSTPSEMLRLNTSTPPTPPATQNDLGVLGGDLAGFPNGRRPYDDVVDVALRAAEGALCGVAGPCGSPAVADPNAGAAYTDGARAAGASAMTVSVSGAQVATDTYLDVFPYLGTPLAGSPNAY